MWRLRAVALLVLALPAVGAEATVLTISDNGDISISASREAAPPRPSLAPLPAPVPAPPSLAVPLARAAAGAALADELVAAIGWVESHFRVGARSRAGAIGVMQLMPATARDLGVDPYDPAANLQGGARYLRSLLDRFDGDLVKAIAAYNAGPGAVDRHQGVPPYPETRRYVATVLARLAAATPPGARQ